MTPWNVARFLIALLFLLFASLAFLPAPTVTLFQLKVAATEYGHWFAIASAILIFLGGRRAALDTASMAVAAITTALLLSSSVRASMLAAELPARFDAAIPAGAASAGHSGAPFSWGRLWSFGKPAPVEAQVLEYAEHEEIKTSLDFFPAQGRAPAPCVIVLHTGGWDSGDRHEFQAFSHHLAQRGYAVAAIDYRLAPRWKWPAQRDDLVSAIDYMQGHATDLGVDPKNIVVFGRSAGGQIAQALAYSGKKSAIRGVIAFYTPADMHFAFKYAKPSDILNSDKLLRQLLGGTPEDAEKNYDSASGFQLAKDTSPPTLLIHGEKDELVWARQSERLDAQLKIVGAKHFFIELPWATHAFDYNYNGPGGQIALWAVDRFLDRVTANP